MKEKIAQITGHIQERCLWQFFSRSWDREENIEGIINRTVEILNGENSILATALDKTFYADAKVLVSDLKRLFPWLEGLGKDDIKTLLSGVKDRLLHITVKGSHNEELNDPNY